MYKRAEKLFGKLLPYVTDMLSWEESFELPADLQPQYEFLRFHTETPPFNHSADINRAFLNPNRTKDNVYFCVLYNDEHHAYDHVVYTLQRAMNCEEFVAEMHTSLTDKEVFLF